MTKLWRPRGIIRAIAVGSFAALAVGSPALADPAGPTDYLSEVVSVEPPTASIEVTVLGGDSFVQLIVAEGTEVIVIGYRGEDYLRFSPDGTVSENQNSPSKYTNDDRYGGGEIPPSATPEAEPEWKQIASNGRWSWHDHRAHWMQQTRPFGQSAGDQILEAVVPLVVDGAEVDVTVISTWQPEPSTIPMWLGVLLGILLSVGALIARARLLPAAAFAIPASAFALLVGVWQYFSLPSETGPRPLWWVLPAIAMACAMVGVVAGMRRRWFIADAALLAVGVEHLMWGLFKRSGLNAAIIPTNAPQWFDRFATALSLVTGVGFIAVALWWLFGSSTARVRQRVSGSTEQQGSLHPAQP